MDKLFDTVLLMLDGSEITLEIFAVTLVLALPLGMLAALGRLSQLKLLSRLVEFYVWIMRGTPLMLQLLFVYFALPMVGIRLPDLAAALLAFTLNYAAYFAEIFRAGIQSIPRGQFEAADSQGFNYLQKMMIIILPQSIKIILPPSVNQIVNLIKNTAVLYIIGGSDLISLTYNFVTGATTGGAYAPAYLVCGVLFFILCFPLTTLATTWENKLKQQDARTPGAPGKAVS